VNYKVDSSALASVVTSCTWTDRFLGESKMASVPVNLTWIIAGNNPKLSNEIARRCVRIRLDAKVENPENRTDFKHKNLDGWVKANRARLVWACLVLIQNWLALGRPEGEKVKGSFEGWSTVIGGILQAAGVPGFLGNDRELRNDADEEGNAIKAFLSAWWERFGESEAPIGGTDDNLFDLVAEFDLALPITGGNDRAQKTSLGGYVARLDGRMFSFIDSNGECVKVIVQKAGAHNNATRWKLTKVEG